MKKFFLRAMATVFALGFFGLAGCKPTTVPAEEITVYMPDGAPALALAKLMYEDTEEDGVTYRVVNSNAIQTKVANKDEAKNADLCILPVTAAAKLLGSGERYTLLGTVTHGNLYLIAKDKPAITAENLSDLIGKKVGVLQMAQVPGLTFKTTLNKYGVPWQEWTNEVPMVEDKVNLVAIEGNAVGSDPEIEYYMLAEPAVSVQTSKGYSVVGNIQTLYGGERGYPQAVLVAKNVMVTERAAWTRAFVQKVDEASAWLQQTDGATLVSTVSAHLEDEGMATTLKAPTLTQKAIAGCGIHFTYAASDREEITTFLTETLLVNANATAVPSQNFFWNYSK